MKIAYSDPLVFMGLPSGLGAYRLTCSAAEKRVLLRAVAILESAHDLVSQRDPDHQEADELSDALCLAPPAIRVLVKDGFEIGGEA